MSDLSVGKSNAYLRKNYGKISSVIPLPSLIEVQRRSYDQFVEFGNKFDNDGISRVFTSVFPIDDFTGLSTVEYVDYRLDSPRYDLKECIKRGGTYSAPLRATLRLIVWSIDDETGAKEIKSIKEQDVYMGEVPLMTEKATFVVNGTERVIVSQLHRSPGVFFEHDKGKATNSTKLLYSARVIPYRGSWLDFEFDTKDILYFRIDRRRKIHGTIFLKALGLSKEEILDTFYSKVLYKKSGKKWSYNIDADKLKGSIAQIDFIDSKNKEVIVKAGDRITVLAVKKIIAANITKLEVSEKDLIGKVVATNIAGEEEPLFSAAERITEDNIEKLGDLKEIEFVNVMPNSGHGSYIYDTLAVDKTVTKEDALLEIYKVLRPGDPPSIEASTSLFNDLFFVEDRYDLSAVGRIKLNERLGLDIDDSVHLLTKDDILATVKILVKMKDDNADKDDIDHLGNRRIRSVGELVENQFRIGLVRVQRSIQERMNSVDIDTVVPQDLVNVKPLVSVVREFFGTSQLSQFMDQTNPLSEITHKRRLSALGPGGLTRDRAGFEVRDVHASHYGRVCPIETPEGPNIGLINSLASYAVVNKYGFIETPYRKVENGKVTKEVHYLSATAEAKYVIAQANAKLDKDNKFTADLISCRFNGDNMMSAPDTVGYIDLSPKQVVSVAASLIPFLENDDANRALMGSNMQRQAVPLLYAEAPLVGTGMERVVASDSSACVVARRDGVVEQVDSCRILIKAVSNDAAPSVDIYDLEKYQRSNQDTCINQKPLVRVGDIVKKGEVLADGPSTKLGELALGRNVLVGFMPWNGYNFEDSILISEKLIKDDVFTSIHIEEFEIVARDTRLGSEEVTRDIPNVSEEVLSHLDEIGIVNVGAEIKEGEVLVGKVTPKSESPATPEEKLLRAIFGEKAAEVRDSSLYVPPGVKGTVVDVRVFTRRGVEKDERTVAIERQHIDRISKDHDDRVEILEDFVLGKVKALAIGEKVEKAPTPLKAGEVLKEKSFDGLSLKKIKKILLKDADKADEIAKILESYTETLSTLESDLNNRVEKLQSGDDLAQGVLKIVKVFVAIKRKLQPGDKMAGRHGNKGVISKIAPIEDMPYLEDGTPLDIVLNPLGVPSRMNVGQIMETHLGLAVRSLGHKVGAAVDEYRRKQDLETLRKEVIAVYDDVAVTKEVNSMNEKDVVNFAHNLRNGVPIATPVFDGAKIEDIDKALIQAGLDTSGQQTVYDGTTGEMFDRKVTVGYIYMLKLHHLVDDKIHARSIGPYSLVTQQPLGGKSHFGGQRFGEMECWALQAYGAAYTLQEMLTVKSDDVSGRIKLYESVVSGDNNFEYGIPESFNVMIKELKSLCLNVELEQSKD
jgi:DNA-directed RNA polymerase subunit beta